MSEEEYILKEYKRLGSPIAFSSPYNIYLHLGKKVALNRIKKLLTHADTYTLHKETKSQKPVNPTYVYEPRKRWDIDLGEFLINKFLVSLNKTINFS